MVKKIFGNDRSQGILIEGGSLIYGNNYQIDSGRWGRGDKGLN